MRKLIAAINMTLDGFCDHDKMIADEDIHQHYTELRDAKLVQSTVNDCEKNYRIRVFDA